MVGEPHEKLEAKNYLFNHFVTKENVMKLAMKEDLDVDQ